MHILRRTPLALRALRSALEGLVGDEEQRARFPHARFGSGVLLRGADRIRMGNGVFVDHRAYLAASDVNAKRGYIHLGNGVEIGPYCVLWGGGGIEIGDAVHLGAYVHITSQAGHPDEADADPAAPLRVDVAPVRIEHHVLLYSGAIVVPGVTIGHHAVIGAGSVVIDDVPPYATAVGAPARVASIRANARSTRSTGALR